MFCIYCSDFKIYSSIGSFLLIEHLFFFLSEFGILFSTWAGFVVDATLKQLYHHTIMAPTFEEASHSYDVITYCSGMDKGELINFILFCSLISSARIGAFSAMFTTT